jgi:RimK family alpha-L-glutamate ligase
MKRILIIRRDPNDASSKKFICRGKEFGLKVDIVRYQDFEIQFEKNSVDIQIPSKKSSFYDYDGFLIHQNLRSCDFIKNTLIASAPESMRIINKKAFQDTFGDINKLTQLCSLAQSGFPVIPTLFQPSHTSIQDFFSKHSTAISKPIRGSKGNGIEELSQELTLEQFSDTSFSKENLLQEMSQSSCDYRILVFDGTALGVMKREKPESKTFVTTNFSSGGIVSAHEADPRIVSLAEKAASYLKLDYCGVDIMEHNHEYMILEVNTAAQFDGFEQALKIDVASQILKLMIS